MSGKRQRTSIWLPAWCCRVILLTARAIFPPDVRPPSLRYDYLMSHAIYDAWVQLMSWLEEYAGEHGLVFDREADFPEYIYRMHKPWELPTRVMTVSLSRENDEPFFIASVSQPSNQQKHVGMRAPGAHLHWHAHEHGGALELAGGVKLDKSKLFSLVDQARHDWMVEV